MSSRLFGRKRGKDILPIQLPFIRGATGTSAGYLAGLRYGKERDVHASRMMNLENEGVSMGDKHGKLPHGAVEVRELQDITKTRLKKERPRVDCTTQQY